MILQLERPLVFIDLETTGLDPERDRIIEVGLLRLLPDGRRETMVQALSVDLPKEEEKGAKNAAKVHRIAKTDMAATLFVPKLRNVAAQLLDFIGDGDLAGFNIIDFDLPMWRAECQRNGIQYRDAGRHLVDAKVVFHCQETTWDRVLMGPRNLRAAVRFYCGRDLRQMDGTGPATSDGDLVERSAAAHSAAADVEASADVLLAQLARYPDLPRTVPGLHEYCRTRQEQARRQSVG